MIPDLSSVVHFYGQKSSLARMNFAWVLFWDIAPSLLEGGKHFSAQP